MNQIIIYIPEKTPRNVYTFELLFQDLLGIPKVLFSTDLFAFVQTNNTAKINYSHSYISDIPFFYAQGLLEEKSISNIKPVFKKCQDLPAAFFFEDSNLNENKFQKSFLPFDPFALVFYLVSRYEEYLDFVPDNFGRFPAEASAAYKNRFLQQPLVNLWALELQKILLKYYPELEFNLPTFQYTPTYDIDHAYAFLQKGWWRQLGALGRNLWNRDTETLGLQIKTWFRIKNDPYDTFDYLQELDSRYKLKPIYFWLLGDYGEYDKNIHPENKIFQNIIKNNAQKFPIGIHPSFGSNANQDIVDKEIHRLEKISNERILRSRQHFLILRFPETYQRLVHLSIKEDYTMGYAEFIGFRASIASPFYWYDLENEKATDLQIFPFQIMDVTFSTYLKLKPEQVLEQTIPVIQNTKRVGGHFISIWHNSSLCEAWQWKGWRKVYEEILRNVKM